MIGKPFMMEIEESKIMREESERIEDYMMNSNRQNKIAVTTIYFNEKYSDEDKAITEIHLNENHRVANDIVFSMEGFIAKTDIFRSKQHKLVEYLEKENYKKFYKTIEKMARKAQKEI